MQSKKSRFLKLGIVRDTADWIQDMSIAGKVPLIFPFMRISEKDFLLRKPKSISELPADGIHRRCRMWNPGNSEGSVRKQGI